MENVYKGKIVDGKIGLNYGMLIFPENIIIYFHPFSCNSFFNPFFYIPNFPNINNLVKGL